VSQAALWVLAIVMIAVGVAGTLLPALPGIPLMFAGMLLGAWIDDFTRIGWVTLTVLAVLTVLSVIVDVAASALGARRVGASPRAIWGAAIGTVLGIFFGLAGLILGPFIGAVVGELSVHGRFDAAGRVGVATWLGLLFGAVAKVAIAFSMIGVFVFAVFVP
jgi:uncharacterized protein YqgC (DUF456 family)